MQLQMESRVEAEGAVGPKVGAWHGAFELPHNRVNTSVYGHKFTPLQLLQ
jgi:hypothetical protein